MRGATSIAPWGAGPRQPVPHVSRQRRADLIQHPGVVVVEPVTFCRRRAGWFRSDARSKGARVSVSKRKNGLEAPAKPAGWTRSKVFQANAVVAGQVEARLVGQDHAVGDRDGPRQARQTDRAFMHGEVAADAVTSAVIIIQAHRPERPTGERIQVRAGGTGGKISVAIAIWPLQNAGRPLAETVSAPDRARSRSCG